MRCCQMRAQAALQLLCLVFVLVVFAADTHGVHDDLQQETDVATVEADDSSEYITQQQYAQEQPPQDSRHATSADTKSVKTFDSARECE